MGLEHVHTARDKSHLETQNFSPASRRNTESEYDSLINAASERHVDLTTESLTGLLKTSQPPAEDSRPVISTPQVIAQHKPSEQAISEVVKYLTTHPEQVPTELLLALGEQLTLDAANDASVLSRMELDKELKQHPEKVLFLDSFIDRVGISQGRRWVPDKDVAASVQEALLARSEEISKGRLQRAFNVLMGRDANLFQTLTDKVENLYAAKIALERDIQEHKAILASTVKDIKNREAESQFRALEENKKIVIEQIARQEQLIVELKAAHAEIAEVRSQQAKEIVAHEQRLGALEQEYQKSLTEYASRATILETQWLQKQTEAQHSLNSLSEKISDTEHKNQIKTLEIETKYRLLELELQAKFATSEARFNERAAEIRTEIAALLEKRDATMIERGLNPKLGHSLEEAEKRLTAEIQNSIVFQGSSHHNLVQQVGRTLTRLVAIENSFGGEAASAVAKRLQNTIVEVFEELIKFNPHRLVHRDSALEVVRLLSCPDIAKTESLFAEELEKGTDSYSFSRKVTLYLSQFELNIKSGVDISNGNRLHVKDYQLIQQLAELNKVKTDDLLVAFSFAYSKIADVNLARLVELGVTNIGEFLSPERGISLVLGNLRDERKRELYDELRAKFPGGMLYHRSAANA